MNGCHDCELYLSPHEILLEQLHKILHVGNPWTECSTERERER
jgi:hypothetical protein